MGYKLEGLKKIHKKWFRMSKQKREQYNYIKYYHKLKIEKDTVLIEARQGKELASNMFYLVKEIADNHKYDKYKVYIVTKQLDKKGKSNTDEILKMFERYNIPEERFIFISHLSKEYYKACASVEYLITDVAFYPFYIKKDGQKILNTWHGTPLKGLGRNSEHDFASLGNMQRNLLFSDYMLSPNKYTEQCMFEDFMLDTTPNDCKSVLGGYPRNSVFFTDSKERVRKWLIEDKIIDGSADKFYFFMPTWRETKSGEMSQILSVHFQAKYLYDLDNKLADNEVLFLKLHPLAQKAFNANDFKHIKPFPKGKGYETYDFLNAMDVLITDYSSVFFDYATKRNKIVLWVYDKEDYIKDRGFHISIDTMPFPQVNTVDELLEEMRSPVNYDDSEFIATYNNYDNIDAPRKALDLLFEDNTEGFAVQPMWSEESKKKKNILIYPGELYKNGITTAFFNLLKLLDTDKYNVFVTFREYSVRPHKGIVKNIPTKMNYIPIQGEWVMTKKEWIVDALYRINLYPAFLMNKRYDKICKDELDRCFYGIKFDDVIQFNGYDYRITNLLGRVDSTRSIYVHNDMIQEIKSRNAQHNRTLKYAYANYDNIVLVNESLAEPTKHFMHSSDYNKLRTVPNPIPYEDTLKLGNKSLEFSDETICDKTLDELKDFIKNKDKVFITIGRFSEEKKHKRLIDAFNKLQKEYSNIGLIILGGRGDLFEETVEYAHSNDSIVVIQAIRNPQPLLRMCDCFVLSSDYEGQPMVIAEADTQGLPIVCTDCCGEHNYVVANGGHVFEKSIDGVYKGMKEFMQGDLKPLNIDYELYNKRAKEDFEALLV